MQLVPDTMMSQHVFSAAVHMHICTHSVCAGSQDRGGGVQTQVLHPGNQLCPAGVSHTQMVEKKIFSLFTLVEGQLLE